MTQDTITQAARAYGVTVETYLGGFVGPLTDEEVAQAHKEAKEVLGDLPGHRSDCRFPEICAEAHGSERSPLFMVLHCANCGAHLGDCEYPLGHSIGGHAAMPLTGKPDDQYPDWPTAHRANAHGQIPGGRFGCPVCLRDRRPLARFHPAQATEEAIADTAKARARLVELNAKRKPVAGQGRSFPVGAKANGLPSTR